MAAISYDSPAILKNFAERRGITYPLLSDPDSKVIRSFGLLNNSVRQNTPQFGIPHPGTFILDPKGVVTRKYFEEDYGQRVTSSDILVRQFGEKGAAPGQSVETKHLRLSSSASMAAAHTGQRLALVLDIDLKPRMHVYAPGIEGYIPIDWKITGNPALKVHEAIYPASTRLHLKAIKETVPVYKGRLRLVQEVTIGPEAQVKPVLAGDGTLAVEGNFRYQACDDRVCYLPQTIPLKWILKYEPLDRERAPAEMRR